MGPMGLPGSRGSKGRDVSKDTSFYNNHAA